ncbi:MAG: recombination mediator RecR [Candidatus Omnitrophica bacterium]|nr:recombination mediator RecR [Candidatus Omnitrophota bacterium]MBU2043684.1 recombination mediator RecR [Candidatus Omnitrophota bacterium]MBU2266218.1 recombination mediator RecR [Candidatus Omnitrophota bacterium]MBU2474170.1 recombination mediator RecR [Candidatus Omnitrophota bacterium]
MSFSRIFNELVRSFSRFPGVGRRTAERLVFHLLKMNPQEVKDLSSKMEEIHNHIKPCRLCNNFSTKDICSICDDPKREKDTICVVEEPKDIMAIEKTANYKGLYYVLLGSLSPLEGINSEDLNIGKLINRIQKAEINEVIISTDPDNEGELTAQFLIQKLSPYPVKIYRIAIGVPLGTQIEYIDSATLGKALLERKALT